MFEWMWTCFPIMLIQEKCYVQLKWIFYNAVSQMCSRSLSLLDSRYVLICFVFMKSDLYFYNLHDSRRPDNWLWLFKKYLRRVRYSMSAVFNDIEITASVLYPTQCRYRQRMCAMSCYVTNTVGGPQRFERLAAIIYSVCHLVSA